MSAVPPESGSGVVDAYRAGGADLDELVDARRAGDQTRLADALDGLGLGALRAASAEAARLVADDGIRYGAASDGGQARSWVLDPIPVVLGAREWADLTDGLDQRAHLLDALPSLVPAHRTRLCAKQGPDRVDLALAHVLPPVRRQP